MKKPFKPAPPDPGIKPGGIRDRAMQAVLARGPRPPETSEELRRAQEYWAKYRAEQAQRRAEEAKRAGTAHEPHDPSKIAHRPAQAGCEAAGGRDEEKAVEPAAAAGTR